MGWTERAIESAEAVGTLSVLAAARHRRAALTGDEAEHGAALDLFGRSGVAEPERFAGLLAPGLGPD